MSCGLASNRESTCTSLFGKSFAATLGDSLSFVFGFSGRHLANKKLQKKEWFQILSMYFGKYGDILLFALALIPNPIFDAIGLVAGVFAYNFFRFFAIVWVGRFIRYFLLASFGSTL